MPGKPWTTAAQDAFLHSFDKKFIEKQEEGTLESWFPTVYEQFLEKWPEQDPDELISVRLRGKDVMQTRLQVRKQVSVCSLRPQSDHSSDDIENLPLVLQPLQADSDWKAPPPR